MLVYYAELLKMYVKKHDLNIYGPVPISHPRAEFYVAYNGKKPWLLDEAFTTGDITINAKLVDINFAQLPVKDSDNTLSGYAYLVQQLEYYKNDEKLPSQLAVDKALNDCKENGYLVEYTGREEFLSMVTKRWTVEQQMEDYANWAREEGREEGREEERTKAEVELAAERAKAESEKIEIIKTMLNDGLSIEVVAKYLGFTTKKVQELSE